MNLRKAELICTGSELVSARNNGYVPLFAARLRSLGFGLRREHSVGDDADVIAETVKEALRKADLVVTCGGLGPTFDDLTRQGVAKALGMKLVYSKFAEQILRNNYKLSVLPPNFKNQCLIIDGAKMVENANGTAFGQILAAGRKMTVLLPGPLNEWAPMFDGFIADGVKEFFKMKEGTVSMLRLRIAGLWETQAENRLRPVMRRFPDADFTILAGPGTVEFNFTVSGRTPAETGKKRAAIEKACRKILKSAVYGAGEETLEEVTGTLLLKNKATLALAESCTGGGVGDAITDIAGSSEYFMGGVTAYSNEAKTEILGVKKSTLLRRGAVSRECAVEMAEGARRLFRTDYAASVTGIAGPGGGTKEKPVGLVWFAVAGKGMKTRAFTRTFHKDRRHIKRCSVNFILDALRKIIQ